MRNLWAHFFSYVQSAGFYAELHRRSVQLLPSGSGDTWFDVGTGPGLVARLAAEHGYRSNGFDVDEAMIGEARANSSDMPMPVEFEVFGLNELAASGRKAGVVSAASLLAVLGDRDGALHQLMSCVGTGGALLVIETTELMQPSMALAWLRRNGFGRRNWVLLLWAWVRTRQTAVNLSALEHQGYQVDHADVFSGLVSAWVIRRKSEQRRYAQ